MKPKNENYLRLYKNITFVKFDIINLILSKPYVF